MTRLIIIYEGKTFTSKDTDEIGAQEMVERLYDNLEDLNKLKVELTDGTWLLLPTEALKRSVIMVQSSPTQSGDSNA